MLGGRNQVRIRRYWLRLLLIIPFALVIWVPFYNRIEPTLVGIPFFYWYQLAAILLGAFVVMTVYLLERRQTFNLSRRRAKGRRSGVRGDRP